MVFWIGKMGFHQERKGSERLLKRILIHKQSQDVVETNGCKAVHCSMQIRRTHWHVLCRYILLCKKVARDIMFVTPERLPPTASDCNFHSLQT